MKYLVKEEWLLSEYAQELIRRQSEKTGKNETLHINTVMNWFNRMEDSQIHIVERNENSIKIFKEIDFKIGLSFWDKRKRKVPITLILKEIAEEEGLEKRLRMKLERNREGGSYRIFSEELNFLTEEQVRIHVKSELGLFKESIKKEIEEQVKRNLKLQETLKEERVKEDSLKEIKSLSRSDLISDFLLIVSECLNFRDEALASWYLQPQHIRIKKAKKIGGYIENIEEKDKFISNLIQKRLKEKIKIYKGI